MSNAPRNGPPIGLTEQDTLRIEELLADRAVFGLESIDEAEELENLLAAAGHDDDFAPEFAAAAIATSGLPTGEPLPPTLRERVLSAVPAKAETAASPLAQTDPGRMGWKTVALAVAAGLLVSLMINNLRPDAPLSAQRLALIESAEDIVQVAWAPQDKSFLGGGDAGDAPYGDVVWSDATQTGYLRFRGFLKTKEGSIRTSGLKPNDPAVEQYQLWVFDEARNAEHPVDGGVFDLAASDGNEAGEILIPIKAKLPITKATLFAITVEKPGGVVVSDRSRLPLLAQR